MKQLWKIINFDPEVFEIDDVDYNDEVTDTTDNFGGDKKILESNHFEVDRSKVNQKKKEVNDLLAVTIKNFPPDITDSEIVDFLKKEVDTRITVENMKAEKTDHSSTNVVLGPGPCFEVIAKSAEVLDYKYGKKLFFGDRRLYVQHYMPLTQENKFKDIATKNGSKVTKLKKSKNEDFPRKGFLTK